MRNPTELPPEAEQRKENGAYLASGKPLVTISLIPADQPGCAVASFNSCLQREVEKKIGSGEDAYRRYFQGKSSTELWL